MKKALKTLLAFVSIFALILAASDNPDGSMNIIWSGGCLVVSAISCIGAQKLGGPEDED